MLKRYFVSYDYDRGTTFTEHELGDVVFYEDAEKLQLRIVELEQRLKSQEQLRAEFEKDCG